MTLGRAASMILGAAGVGAAIAWAAPASAQTVAAAPPAHAAPAMRKPAPRAPSAKRRPAHPVSHASHLVRKPVHLARKVKTARAGSGVLALAGCYGRFIAWRDELSALMLQANSYTPWPDDKLHFDRMEQAFAAGVLRDRKLVLTLRPVFREADFPPDVRTAFRAGLKMGSDAFADGRYRQTQILVIGQPNLSPRQRMAQLEANTDEAFAPLAAPCERPPAS